MRLTVRIRKAMSAGDRRRRIVERLLPVSTGVMLARPFGLTERGQWLDRWVSRNTERYRRVVAKN